MALLLAATRQTPIDGALQVKLSSHGVIFQSMGERFFSDSEWVVVTDVSFNQGDKVANELKMWLIEKTKLPVLGSSSNKDFQTRVDNAFRAVDITIEWLQQLVDGLSGGIASAAMGKISPALFSPAQMQTIISDIKINLPTGWALTPATQAGDTWKSYQEAAVTAAAIENGIRLFIHIPIFQFTRALTLYRVIGMARATKNGSTSLQ
ncbi:hypothetical protein OUZ56_010580 [Daphnia magna]|uniref:Uncharacterized protein n=1 Tax=Daphnia magna TaxID=35525 RepID=A0ABR0AIY0_9CRUS|nr:hypothetical protein OUZ56_010580 [Daphnia magna]